MKRLMLEIVCLLTAAGLSSGFLWWSKDDSSRLDKKETSKPADGTTDAQPQKTDGPATDSGNPAAAKEFQSASDALLKADQARNKGNLQEAVRFYEDAHGLYTKIARKYPDWESSVVKFRTAYCDVRVREILKTLGTDRIWPEKQPDPPAVPTNATPAATPTVSPAAAPVPEKTPVATPLSPIEEIAAAARKLLEQGKPEEARTKLVQGLKINPDDESIRLLIGVAQCQAGNFQDAQRVLKALLGERPGNTTALVSLGAAQFGLGRIDEARQSLESALKIDPALHEAHFNLAQVNLALKPPDKAAALRHYQIALKLGARPDKKLEKALDL